MRLEDVEIPDEPEAEERGWQVARTAFEARVPSGAERRLPRRALVVAAAVLAVAAAALSPPGRAVVDRARRAIGVEHAQPALFRLPAAGKLLAVDGEGAWVVSSDGSKRLLGRYREASWSPHGLFVVASTRLQLAALEPGGREHWTLARRDVRFPRWGGSRTDTRIAYLSGPHLHVVAGDGTGDRDLGPAARVAPAWAPGTRHVLAYVDPQGRPTALDTTTGRRLWRARALPEPRELAWSPDGTQVAVADADGYAIVDAADGQARTHALRGVVALAYRRDGRLAVATGGEVTLVSSTGRPTRVLAGEGPFQDLAWSPDGRWLLVTWPSADEWIFLRMTGQRRIAAVARIREQFDGFPTIGGWCCAP